MYSVSEFVKKMCLQIGKSVFINYKLYFPDIDLIIDNETIHQESVVIKSALSDGSELEFGGCIATQFEFEVSEIITSNLKNQRFTANIALIGNDAEIATIPIGEFIVDTIEMIDDKDYKKIIAYDALKNAAETDISEWYNSMFSDKNSTTSLGVLRNSLLGHLRISYALGTQPNDNMGITKTINPSEGNLTGQALLKMICVLNGGFGIINRNGLFEILHLTSSPVVNLYQNSQTEPEYREVKFEEYECKPITCLKLSTDNEDVGQTVGSDLENPYVISGNYLLYGKTGAELNTIGNNILSYFQVGYRPINATLNAIPYSDIGDKVVFHKENQNITSIILSRELKGIQAMTDSYITTGTEKRTNEVTANVMIEQLKSKTLKIQKNVDGVIVELSDLDAKTTSQITQLSNEIVLKVDSNGNLAEVGLGINADDATTYFKVKSNNISLTADEAIDLIAGGNLNLTGKKITITSDNFNVSVDGTVSIKNGQLYISNDEAYININPNTDNIFEIGVAEKNNSEIIERVVNCECGINFVDAMASINSRVQSDDDKYLYGLTSLNNDHNIYRLDTTSEKNDWEIYDTIDTVRDFGTFIKSDRTDKLYYTLKNSSSGSNYRDLYEYDIESKTSTFLLPFINGSTQIISNGYLYSYECWMDGVIYNINNKTNKQLNSQSRYHLYQNPFLYNGEWYAVVRRVNTRTMDFYVCKIRLSDSSIEVVEELLKIYDNSSLPAGWRTAFIIYRNRLHFFMFYTKTGDIRNFYNHLIYDIDANTLSTSTVNIDCDIYDDNNSGSYPSIVMAATNYGLHMFCSSSSNYADKQHIIYTDIEEQEHKEPEKIFYVNRGGRGCFNGDVIAKSLTLGEDVEISIDKISSMNNYLDNYIVENSIVTSNDFTYQAETDESTGITKVTTTYNGITSTTYASTKNDYVLTNVGLGKESEEYCKISSNGLLTANNAIVHGEIHTSKGFIGGWEIGMDGIKSSDFNKSTTTNGICLNSDGEIRSKGSWYSSNEDVDVDGWFARLCSGKWIFGYYDSEQIDPFIPADTPYSDISVNGIYMCSKAAIANKNTQYLFAVNTADDTVKIINSAEGSPGLEITNNGSGPSLKINSITSGYANRALDAEVITATDSAHVVIFGEQTEEHDRVVLRCNKSVEIKDSDGDVKYTNTASDQGTIGTTRYRWNTGYFNSLYSTNEVSTSDAKLKNIIRELDKTESLQFINKLKPYEYTFKSSFNKRKHMGFTAQGTRDVLNELNFGDMALYEATRIDTEGREFYYKEEYQEEELIWGLKYNEFIAPLVSAVQALTDKVNNLENQIEELKNI